MIHMVLTSDADSYLVAEVDSEIDNTFWYGKLSKVSPMELRTDKPYGGMLRVSGNARFSISPDATEWPLPLKLIADIRNYGFRPTIHKPYSLETLDTLLHGMIIGANT